MSPGYSERKGLTQQERIIAAAVALVLGGIHWVPAPGTAELEAKLDDAKAQVTVLFEATKATNASLAEIKTTLAVANQEETVTEKTVADHEARLRALEINAVASGVKRPGAP